MPIGISAGAAGSSHALGGAARVAQRRRAVVGDRRAQHVDQHRLVARRHHDDVGQRAEVGDVEGAVVGRAVVADQPGAVHREDDVELLQADVVDDLVVGALQEGRVDRADRLGALERQAGGEQDRVLLGDADVVVLLGDLVGELLQPGPPAIAAVIPITRLSRFASATIASAKTCVYWGGGARRRAASPAAPGRSTRASRTP